MSISNMHLANAYKNSPYMAARFIQINGYQYVEIDRDRSERLSWRVWLMRADGCGNYDGFRTRREAVKAAAVMMEVFNLPSKEKFDVAKGVSC
jgi:hypothetical protein